MKPKEAINFALNNYIAPRVKIKNIEWSPLKNQWKVRVESLEEGIGSKYRYTIYFDKFFIDECENALKRGIKKWG